MTTTTTAGVSRPVDAVEVLDNLRAIVIDAITNHPRSQQKRIGPSEIGNPCDHCLAAKLAGWEKHEWGVPWLPTIGTAVHEWLETTVARHEFARIAATSNPDPVWLMEHRVNVGEIGSTEITGSCDLFHVPSGTVIDYKGLALDTEIPTPTGWVTMRSINIGDAIFASDGTPCTVVKKFPVSHRPCFKITFDTGETVICDNVHEWPFVVGHNKTARVMSTESAAQQVFATDKRGQQQLRVVNCAPLQTDNISLPISPYTLGAWIGDGHSWSGNISKFDDEIFDHIAAEGYEVGPRTGARNKNIPTEYLRASKQQRLSLLQGLMDTDGSWSKKRNQAVFSTTLEHVAVAVQELVHSLGWKANVNRHKTTWQGGKTGHAYKVAFVPFGANPFRLSRKADLVRIEGSQRARFRTVRSIEQIESVPTQCIEVDSQDHTYLCTRSFIPTHNCVGSSTLTKVKASGPSDTYRTQANLYGRGWRRAGYDVNHVAIWFLPRNSVNLTDGIPWTAEYDEATAIEALTRANRINTNLEALTAVSQQARDQWITGLPRAKDCWDCRRYRDKPATANNTLIDLPVR